MTKLPLARTTDIVVQTLGKELLIYDLNTHKAFNLNETSSIVYQACENSLNFEDLKRKHKFTDDLIHFALDDLKANALIADYQSNHFGNLSRREVIRRVGLATMIALPVIAGLTAPLAAHAQSAANVCAANNCVDGNVFCNAGAPCSALRAGFVCCFALGSCSCVQAGTCTGNGGTICP